MLEFREDAPIGSLIFWSIALVVWLVVRFRSRKSDIQSDIRKELRKGKRENSE